MLAPDHTSPFLERESLLERLAEVLQRTAEGGPRFIGLVAEAGAGKSRLVEELRRLHSDQATFLVGRAFQSTATTPYSVWVDALEPHLRHLSRRELLHVIGGSTDLPRIFASCGHLMIEPPSTAGSDTGLEQTRISGQMAAMLTRMSRDRTLVLVLDNLQWADTTSVELLHAVMRAIDNCRVMVLGLFRSDQVGPESALGLCVNSLMELGLVDQLSIPPLSVEATAAIVAHEAGRDWPVGAVHRLHHLTQGNALFVQEFGKRAAKRRDDGSLEWTSVDELPKTVQALLNERLWELDEDCRRVLALSATFEAPIGYELLLALTGFAEDRLLDAMDRLCQLRLLSETVRESSVLYDFHKPLVQATVYRSMGIARRQFQHRLIAAELIRAKDRDAATIARHLIAGAAPGNHAEALPYLLRASRDAVAVFGNHEAISLLDSALKVIGAGTQDSDLRPGIYLDLGESNKRLGRFEDAIAAWTTALPEASPRLAARLRRCIARACWQAGREGDAMRALVEGIAQLGEAYATEEAAFLRQEYALALARQGNLREALDGSSIALALVDEDRNPEVVARVFIVIGLAHGYRGDLRSAMQALRKAIELSEGLAYPGAAFLAHYTMAGLLRFDGSFAAFEEQCEACIRIADRMHSVALASWPLSIRTERYIFEGRLREAIRFGEHAVELDRGTGQGAVLPRTHAFLAVAFRMTGDLVKARRHLDESRRLVRTLEKREMRVVAVQTCCEAFVEFHDGNLEAALALIESLQFVGRTGEPNVFYALHPYALPLAAEAAARLDRQEEARRCLASIQDLCRGAHWNCEGAILHVGALLKAARGELAAARGDAERAIAVWIASSRLFDAARARVDLSDWLEALGHGELAADQLHLAGECFSQISAVREAAAVGHRLRKLGRRPLFGQQRQTAGQPISNREAEVAALVAEGKSNKEIAAHLFLSELTIETHMKNILRKLGLKSRTQVAAYAVSQNVDAAEGAQLLPFRAGKPRRIR